MPYIVTTKRPGRTPHFAGLTIKTSRAVATLDEARVEAGRILSEQKPKPESWFGAHPRTLPESGGTVGPLPDGTVIEVEAVHWLRLARRAGVESDGYGFPSVAQAADLLAAYNDRETSS